ncbi:hypothetical protein B0H66DRAFT_526913 [Apodospora peruviana]|uniref:Zn(2)-C6 fungal-type domain-containing protein n=1 Tax=Apodospora peruviana TaxID=516989 RepID=A0AAE0IQS7_9PEZI|nr:hypothetical protein B0H66DRAFT_526913 [Apodospora peruviana]
MSAASSSPAASPPQAAAKSSRVCLNCRRKKKRCDKGLPACSRCIESRQVCQHEDDIGLGSNSSTPGSHRYEPLLSQYVPSGSHQLGPGYSTLNPSLFATMDTLENIHHFVFRTVLEVAENRQGVENVAAAYFRDVNTWFTVVQQQAFERQLDDLWINPSAETGVLILCMRLIIRPPNSNPFSGMADRHYLSTKTMLSLVQTKVQLSIPLLQAELLIALYEFSHAMPQQVYMSVGNCFQMTRAFGWQSKSFWTQGPQSLGPRELKLCSILWWAIVYVDCLVHVGYQDQKYPIHTSNTDPDFAIPYPEAFDQYLPGSGTYDFQNQGHGEGFGYLDADLAQIDSVVWPEANSAGYLSSVLQQLSGSNPSVATRNSITEMIMGHTINLLAHKRTAAVGTNFIALMKVNQPGLLAGASALPSVGTTDVRPIETIRSVIDSVCSAALTVEQSGLGLSHGGFAPCGAFAAYYAALLLISHGDGVLHDSEWLLKVESLKKTLESLCGRWTIAEKYLESVNIALSNRLGGYVA